MNPHRLAVVCVVLGVVLLGNAKREVRAPPEVLLFVSYRNLTATAGGAMGGTALPSSRGFNIERVTIDVPTISGGGAGNTVIRFTDGAAQNCDATVTCVATQTAGVKVAALSGSCAFPPGATIRASVATAGCTTTQPVITSMNTLGNWL